MRVQDPLLGTRAEVSIAANTESVAEEAEQAALAEAARLESIFTVFDSSSALRELRETGTTDVPELGVVHRLAEEWVVRTNGAFNPSIQPLVDLWDCAEADDSLPDSAELQRTAMIVGKLPPEHLNFNAIAKGWIADRSLATALVREPSATGGWLSLGGDLVHRGDSSVVVGIEDPARPYDNVAPFATIELSNEALATSGSARRWWTIGSQRFSKVLDPRTGRPVSEIASATVVASTAADADVLATAAIVVGPTQAQALVAASDAICLLVLANGEVISSSERFRRG